MTKKEEIKNEAITYSETEENFFEYDDCGYVSDDKEFIEQVFIEGAKWSDEHPYSNGKELLYVAHKTAERTKKEVIINACDWLDNINTDDYMDSGVFQMSDLISDFKKAMEE